MLLYPSVDKLLEKVDSRYKLIALGPSVPVNWMLACLQPKKSSTQISQLVKHLKKLKTVM